MPLSLHGLIGRLLDSHNEEQNWCMSVVTEVCTRGNAILSSVCACVCYSWSRINEVQVRRFYRLLVMFSWILSRGFAK